MWSKPESKKVQQQTIQRNSKKPRDNGAYNANKQMSLLTSIITLSLSIKHDYYTLYLVPVFSACNDVYCIW